MSDIEPDDIGPDEVLADILGGIGRGFGSPKYPAEQPTGAALKPFLGDMIAACLRWRSDHVTLVADELTVLQPSSYRSWTIDHVLFRSSTDRSREAWLLLDVGTDPAARQPFDNEPCRRAAVAGMPALIDGVGALARRSRFGPKYRRQEAALRAFPAARPIEVVYLGLVAPARHDVGVPLHTVLWTDAYQIDLPRRRRAWQLFRNLVIGPLLAAASRG